MNTGLYIGRFQPFHLGHLSAIKQALKKVDKLLIIIGSSQYDHQPHNPFTAEERRTIIETALKEANIPKDKWEVFLVPDIHDNDRWTTHLREIVPKFETVFVGREGLVKDLFEKDGTPVHIVEKEINISGTEIRQKMTNNENWKAYLSPSTAELLVSIKANPIHK